MMPQDHMVQFGEGLRERTGSRQSQGRPPRVGSPHRTPQLTMQQVAAIQLSPFSPGGAMVSNRPGSRSRSHSREGGSRAQTAPKSYDSGVGSNENVYYQHFDQMGEMYKPTRHTEDQSSKENSGPRNRNAPVYSGSPFDDASNLEKNIISKRPTSRQSSRGSSRQNSRRGSRPLSVNDTRRTQRPRSTSPGAAGLPRPDSTNGRGNLARKRSAREEMVADLDDGVGIYSGPMRNGKKHGIGKYVWTQGKWGGDLYEGGFENGLRHGYGSYRYSNGNVYEGEWEQGMRCGKGTFTWLGGDVYEGFWKNNHMHGFGKRVWPLGDTYTGEWQESQRHGEGSYLYVASGDRYEGQLVQNKKQGRGSIFYANGDTFTGMFHNDNKHGTGILVSSDSRTFLQTWKDNSLLKQREQQPLGTNKD